jgi:hypothetical protein
MDVNRRLSRREFEEVMRRAVELAEREAVAEERELTEGEVVRIAGEVGLPEAHVRQALVDIRSQPAQRGTLQAMFGPPLARAFRIVPGSREAVNRTLDDFMVTGQLLHPIRQSRELLLYRPASDMISSITRTLRSASRPSWASAKRVEVRLEEAGPDATWVEIEVDPGSWDRNVAGGLIGGLGGGVGIGVGIGTLAVALVPLAIAAAAGAVAGASVGGGIAWTTGRSHRNRMEELQVELEGVLDQLESGRGMEPNTPGWRRWIERQTRSLKGEIGGWEDGGRES